jgi:hypothetical protein
LAETEKKGIGYDSPGWEGERRKGGWSMIPGEMETTTLA